MTDSTGKQNVPIMELIEFAESLRKQLYEGEGVEEPSSTLGGLASGLDVGLTLLESSLGAFDGLTKESAAECREYFRNESAKHRADDLELSIWYFSYALAIEAMFLPDDKILDVDLGGPDS